MPDATDHPYRCETCGTALARAEYVAVGPTTPAARHLGIADRSRDHLVACEDCFETATDELTNTDTTQQ